MVDVFIEISVPAVGRGSPRLWVGDEELEGAPASGKLLGVLQRPEYSIFRIFPLGHLLWSDGLEGISKCAKRLRGGDKMRGKEEGKGGPRMVIRHQRPGERKREVRYKTNNFVI
jgi:hypothetical protein